MSNINKWAFVGNVYSSTYKGKDWSQSSNSAWTSFPWNDLTSGEKQYIREIFNGYTNGTGKKGVFSNTDNKYWPVSEINPNEESNGANLRRDTGKFIFMDLFNLAPTLSEYHGLGSTKLDEFFYDPNTKTFGNRIQFYQNFKSVRSILGKGEIYSSNISMGGTKEFRYFSGDSGLLRSVRYNPDNNYYGKIIENEDIPWENFYYPYEREFKLSWMRQLVEYGVEGRIGPFAFDFSAPNTAILTSAKTNKIRIGNIDKLLRHRSNYKLALFYDWAQNEYEWATNRNTDRFGFNEFYPSYLDNPYPKAPVEYLQEITAESQIKIKKSESHVDIVLALGVSGKKNTQAHGIENFSRTEETPAAPPRTPLPTHITTKAVLPYFKDDTDRKNYVVSGWVELPGLITGYDGKSIRLPWPFVWKYIGITGFYEGKRGNFGNITPGEEIIDKFYKENPNLPNKLNEKLDGDNQWRYNWRARLWHYRYESQDIPDRELLFYIRMKYGVSRTTGHRYVASSPVIGERGSRAVINAYNTLFEQITKVITNPSSLLTLEGVISNTPIVRIITLLTSVYAGIFKLEDIPRLRDSLIGGGLPNENDYFGLTGTTLIEDYAKGISTYPLKKDDNNIPYLLRSMYISAVHDTAGWNRFVVGKDIGESSNPDPKTKRQLTGREDEIVNYNSKTGFYSFNGHGTDRLPWSVGRSYHGYKQSMKSEIKRNDLCLYPLFKPTEIETPPFRDKNDRYSSPEHLQSYNWSGTKPVEIEKNKEIYYHNHASNPKFEGKPLRVNGEFHPGLLSPKELQFTYEAVSYILYGITARTDIGGDEMTLPNQKKYWERSFKHRWDELTRRINIPLYDLEKSYSDGKISISAGAGARVPIQVTPQVLRTKVTTLADYILWAAPTFDQYNKKAFSSWDDTFLSTWNSLNIRSRDKNEGWMFENRYPMHAMAQIITDSEKSSMPLVPAFVHHRYFSRKMNNEGSDKYENGVLKEENFAINSARMDLSNLEPQIRQNIIRALGGIDDLDSNIDKGVLITLPRFILGGRLDLGEKIEETWDSTWGTCPFHLVNEKLVVGDLEQVLDNWAKRKPYTEPKTKKQYYVSAMEIMFWIRYRHGLSATPSERRIVHGIGKTSFPNFLNNLYIKGVGDRKSLFDGTSIGEKDLLSTEYLNNIPMVTSYYSPIIVDEYSKMCHDPLIELDTVGPNYLTQFNWERAAYTGFNSYYACDWPGADLVTGLRKVNAIAFRSSANYGNYFLSDRFDSSIFSVNSTYPNTTAMFTDHSNHYLTIHGKYREVERNRETGYLNPSSKGILVTGFDFHTNIDECRRVMLASDIQSWFKGYKLCVEMDNYSDYIYKGLQKAEGQIGSVLEVEAEIEGEEGTAHLFISGEGIGSKDTSFRRLKTAPLTFEERMRVRPWFDRLETDIGHEQEEVIAMCDDYSLGSNGCIPNYIYMRHILFPNIFMYVSSNVENPKGGFYTIPQLDKIKSAFHTGLQFWSKVGYETGTYTGQPNKSLVESELDSGIPLKNRPSGLAMQAITLSSISSHWQYDKNYEKDTSKVTRTKAYVNYYTKYNSQKFIWNTSQKAFTTIFTSIGSIYYLETSILEKLPNLDRGTFDLLNFANKALEKNTAIRRWFLINNIIKNGISPIKDGIKYIKYAVDIWNSGALGNSTPSGVQSSYGKEFDAVVKYGKPHFTFIKDLAFAKVEKTLIKKATQEIILRAGGKLTALSEASSTQLVNISRSASINIGLSSLAISVVTAVVSYAIDRIIEEWEINQKIEALWALMHKANALNYVEGPYLQSEGTVKIRKTPTGRIPILGTVYEDTDDTESKKKNSHSKEFKLLNLEKMSDTELINFIYEQNELFYKSGGVLDKILKDISKDSCECKFFTSIFDDNIPNNHKNKEIPTGHWLRRLENRKNVLDEAPVFSDIPLVFQTVQEPFADVAFYPDWAQSESTQRSPIELEKGVNDRKNIRRQGTNGTRISDKMPGSSEYVCPRFWWPTLLVTPSLNLCHYMALGGKYPQAKADYIDPCETRTKHPQALGKDDYIKLGLSNEIKIDREKQNNIFFDKLGTPEKANEYASEIYSRVNTSGGEKQIFYHKPGQTVSTTWKGTLISFSANELYTTAGNANVNLKISRGEQIYTADGVHGPAPPHEREIINIFRKKYNIDLVLPAVWENTQRKKIYNPYKYQDETFKPGAGSVSRESLLSEYTMKPTTCCAISQVATGSIVDNESQLPTETEVRKLYEKKQRASDSCEYVITLNTKMFKERLIARCKTVDNSDNSTLTRDTLTHSAPVPLDTPSPEVREESPNPPGIDGHKDPDNNPTTADVNPRIPGCTNCESKRTNVLGERKFTIEERLRRRKPTYRTSYINWNLSTDFAFFNQLSFDSINIDWPWGSGNEKQSRGGSDGWNLLIPPSGLDNPLSPTSEFG